MEADEFRPILTQIREFVRKVVVPAEETIERTDEIPAPIRQQAADMGLFGYAIPQEYGGLGVTMSEEIQIALELGYTTPAFRSLMGTNNGIAGQVFVNIGTEAQKQAYLPRLASGELLASFCLTEQDAGSDPSGMATRATRTDDGYRISGSKRFITNATRAGVHMVFARSGPESAGTKGISVFAVDAARPGVQVGEPDEKMGQHGTTTSDVYFDDVLVPADALVGQVEGQGFGAAMKSLAKGRLHIAAICCGLGQRLVEESVTWANSARQGGRPISRFQLVQALIAESQAELYAGRAMVIEAAAQYDSGADRKLGPSCSKLFCSEMVGRIADRAVQVHGGMGYMKSVPVERFYRDVRLFRLYEGTSEIQKLIIARALLDADA